MTTRSDDRRPYVSRGGLKLRAALDAFAIDVRAMVCADLGCSTGGFTDCLLQAGAAKVTSVDTGYGVLAWKLRQDARVKVIERSNALHTAVPPEADKCDLVVIDLGWTPQKLCIPAALGWLKTGGSILSLIKPHYEDKAAAQEHRGILPDAVASAIVAKVLEEMAGLGVRVRGVIESPIRGSKATREGEGNLEQVAWLTRL